MQLKSIWCVNVDMSMCQATEALLVDARDVEEVSKKLLEVSIRMWKTLFPRPLSEKEHFD